MGKKKRNRKHEWRLTRAETAGLLREFADQIDPEGTGKGPGDLPDLKGFRKVKLDLRRKWLKVAVKLKAEGTDPAGSGSPGAGGGPDPRPEGKKAEYKILKKRMKKTFKSISEALEAGRLPESGVVSSFLSDSRLMVGFPGYGDAFYEPYRAACRAFGSACEAEDIEAVRKAYADLDRLKSQCHDDYK